jgi:hypothetical protein
MPSPMTRAGERRKRESRLLSSIGNDRFQRTSNYDFYVPACLQPASSSCALTHGLLISATEPTSDR